MLDRKDWLLMALAHRHGLPLTPVQIQKSMFLMKMEAAHKVGTRFYEFVAYNYGPFSRAIYGDLEALAASGLVAAQESGREWSNYVVTVAGLEISRQLEAKADDPKAIAFLHRVVDWVTALDFQELVRSIYEKYPEYKVNSVFAG